MTLLNDQSTAISDITAEERGERLAAASSAWNERIARDPSNAALTAKVTGRGVGAIGTEIQAGRHRFLVDEPAGLAGDDGGPSPVEYALGALIGCQVVVFRLYAQTLGLTIDDIEITAEGDLDARKLLGIDESGRAGFHDVRVRVEITGPNTAEEYDRLRAVVEEHCPVLDLFANTVPVSGVLA